MNEEVSRLLIAEGILRSWMGGIAHEYTDYVLTPEVQSVLDIGDAINRGEISLAPTVNTASARPVEPFILTPQIKECIGRIEEALNALQERRAALMRISQN